jgi:AcrR family transcriptional regulator
MMGMARAIPLNPDARRAQILDASRQVFAERGFHRASVSDIIAAAGVARGTFYNYFESKRAVFRAVLEDVMDAVAGAVLPIDISASIPQQVEDNLDRLVVALTEHGDVARVLFAEAAGIDDEGEAALRSFYRAATDRIRTALTLGQSLGVVREGDTQMMARLLLGMIREPVFQAWLYGEDLDTRGLVAELALTVKGGMLR